MKARLRRACFVALACTSLLVTVLVGFARADAKDGSPGPTVIVRAVEAAPARPPTVVPVDLPPPVIVPLPDRPGAGHGHGHGHQPPPVGTVSQQLTLTILP